MTGQSSGWAFKVGQEDKGQQGVVGTAWTFSGGRGGGSPVGSVAAFGKVAGAYLGGLGGSLLTLTCRKQTSFFSGGGGGVE